MPTPEQKLALCQIAEASVAAERATGLPAELSAAQCIFESAWLTRCPGNNCFGIKPDDHGAGVQYFVSREFIDGSWVTKTEAFEKYDSLADCFTDHARLITEGEPYAAIWQRYWADHDLDSFILALGRIYGTDPSYGAKILAEAHSPDLLAAVQLARSAAIDQASGRENSSAAART